MGRPRRGRIPKGGWGWKDIWNEVSNPDSNLRRGVSKAVDVAKQVAPIVKTVASAIPHPAAQGIAKGLTSVGLGKRGGKGGSRRMSTRNLEIKRMMDSNPGMSLAQASHALKMKGK